MVVDEVLAADVLQVLRRETGREDLAYDGEPSPLTGGFWAQLIAFRLADPPPGWGGPLVARVMPDAGIAAKETAFQAAVSRQGYATPTVHASGGPADGVGGRAYLVMDLASGRPLLAGLDGGAALAKLPSLARRLPVLLASVLADLHRLDPDRVVAALRTAAVPELGLSSLLESYRDAAGALARSDLVAAVAWLDEHRPADDRIVVCHGDLHPFNVLVDDAGGLTVLDWSAATLAPATYDLGFTSIMLAEPPLVVPRPLRPVVRAAGRALSRRFIRVYEQRSGVRVDEASLRWHQGLICVRALTEVAIWVAAGEIEDRGGHPWVLGGGRFAARLHQLTGASVRPR